MKLTTMYFSPTGTTRRTAETYTESLARELAPERIETLDFGLPGSREEIPAFGREDFLILGLPVYAGRVPNVLRSYIAGLRGEGTPAVLLALYGNRSPGDALAELRELLGEGGFRVIGAGAFIGEHSFSRMLAKGRPDARDLAEIRRFASALAAKFRAGDFSEEYPVPGTLPLTGYYTPLGEDGQPVNFLKAKPATSEACTRCGLCVRLCPMDSIRKDDPSAVPGICIKCCACVKACPQGAKSFEDPGFLSHLRQLEGNYMDPKAPTWHL